LFLNQKLRNIRWAETESLLLANT